MPSSRSTAGPINAGLLAAPSRPDRELASALTDGIVGIEALALALALGRRRHQSAAGRAEQAAAIRAAFLLFDRSTAVAALSGAVLHGLYGGRRSHPVRRALWRISLTAIGLGSLASWRVGSALALSGRTADRVRTGAELAHAGYIAGVATTDVPYMAAVAAYAPGAVFLGWALSRRLADPVMREGAIAGLGALGITFLAAAILASGKALHPRWFDTNATYHAVQALGLGALHVAANRLLDAAEREGPVAAPTVP